MSKPSGGRHDHYEVLNLIGYGLAGFERELIEALGFPTKTALYQHLIDRGVADTVGPLKNRQDLFNPLVRGGRVGWWQNGDRYLHRKLLLDSLFGGLDAGGIRRDAPPVPERTFFLLGVSHPPPYRQFCKADSGRRKRPAARPNCSS